MGRTGRQGRGIERPQLTEQFNVGHVCDLGEADAGPGGCSVVTEVKTYHAIFFKIKRFHGGGLCQPTEVARPSSADLSFMARPRDLVYATGSMRPANDARASSIVPR